jgi:hypothetical protein
MREDGGSAPAPVRSSSPGGRGGSRSGSRGGSRGGGGGWSALTQWRPPAPTPATTFQRERARLQSYGQTPDYSSYTEPEARVVTPFHKTTPEQAAQNQQPQGIRRGQVDTGAPDLEDLIAKARGAYDKVQRTERADVLGTGTEKHGKVQRMTWEEYNKLSSTQRAAIDFNTMLVRAVRKDLKLQDEYDPNAEQRVAYNTQAAKMFGAKGRDSETYAPETMAVLQQIKFKDVNADLDDFLGLRAAITEDDLKNLPLLQSTSPDAVRSSNLSPAQLEGTTFKYGLATSTMALEQALAKGNATLRSVTAQVAQDMNLNLRGFGGVENKAHAGLGFAPFKAVPGTADEPADLNSYFQSAYAKLANEDNAEAVDTILGKMGEVTSPEQYKAFLDYANIRSNNDQRFNLKDILGAKGNLDPSGFREKLGLGKGTPYATQ